MAAGELLVGDPDLLDNAVANLEHRRRTLDRRQVPVVQAEPEIVAVRQGLRGADERRAGTDPVDRVPGVVRRGPHDASRELSPLRGPEMLQECRGCVPDPNAERGEAEEVLVCEPPCGAVRVLVPNLSARRAQRDESECRA